MITETLSPPCGGVLISDSALKVVLSYYPVCRCQRTSLPHTFRHKKNSILCPAMVPPSHKATAGKGDKIEFQFAVPKVRRTRSLIRGAPLPAGQKNNAFRTNVNSSSSVFHKFFDPKPPLTMGFVQRLGFRTNFLSGFCRNGRFDDETVISADGLELPFSNPL